jgi:predicted transcriptional regulator of viral defense system
MHDTKSGKPDSQCLADVASEHLGYFTNADAAQCGFSRALLEHHENTGRLVRIRRGVYRLREVPASIREDVIGAWLAAGPSVAVVSHDSALDLHDLSDVIPNSIHLTLPRAKRYLQTPEGATLHTTTRPFNANEVTVRAGVRLTAPTRTILDAAEAGTGPEQIELAVQQALERGATTPSRLREQASKRSARVRELIDRAIRLAGR